MNGTTFIFVTKILVVKNQKFLAGEQYCYQNIFLCLSIEGKLPMIQRSYETYAIGKIKTLV